LRASEERFRVTFEDAATGMSIVAADGRILQGNQALQRMLGYNDAELRNKRCAELIHPEDVGLDQELYKGLLAGGRQTYQIEQRYLHKDGHAVWGRLSVSLVRDAAGEPQFSIGMLEDITQRKATEVALRLSEERFRNLSAIATEGIMIHDGGLILDVNQAFVALAGYTGPDDLIGKNGLEIIGFTQESRRRLLDHLRTGAADTYDIEIVRPDGTVVPAETCSRQITYQGRAARLVYMRDITDRKQAEGALRDSEEKFRSLFNNAEAGMFRSRMDGSEFLDANDKYLSILGRTREEVIGKPSERPWVDPKEREEVIGILKASGRVSGFECRLLNKANEVINCLISLRLYPETGIVEGSAIDITDRKCAEAEVLRLKNYLANVIDSMPSILVGMDNKEVITQWNRQAEMATGIPGQQAIGQPLKAVLPDFSPWIESLRSETQQRRPASLEKVLLSAGEERRFYDLVLYPLAANCIEGTVVRIEDVTERTRIQELMVQTEKMISVGGLAAGMAHEINNPLGIISQAAQNIERRVSSELPANRQIAEELGVRLENLQAYLARREVPQFLRDVREASARAARIVSNMLQFSRKSESARQSVSLADVLDRTLELAASDYDLKKRYDFRSVEITREYDPVLPAIPMVMVEMEQVFLNLVKNAAQAMADNPPERKPRITLRLKRNERYAVVEVEDNGPGMPEPVRLRVFEPFFTTKEPGAGTGLGLSVSYMIVTQNHKGLIDVHSAPGQGTLFRIRLPLAWSHNG
jgi:PAS domain S-box-containing protein